MHTKLMAPLNKGIATHSVGLQQFEMHVFKCMRHDITYLFLKAMRVTLFMRRTLG